MKAGESASNFAQIVVIGRLNWKLWSLWPRPSARAGLRSILNSTLCAGQKRPGLRCWKTKKDKKVKGNLEMSSLLRISDLTVEAIKALVHGSLYYEQNPQDRRGLLARHKAALVFLKPSLRTRGAFQGAVEELGGNVHCYGPQEVGLGERESPADVARTLKALGYSIIGARVYQHEDLLQMRAACDISVINLLSNDDHPTQAIADALTLYQAWGRFWGRTVAWRR